MAKKKLKIDKLMDYGPADPLAALFGAWRVWLLGALLGAIIAWAAFGIFPPDYRARATVVVDNNLEDAWVYFPDRQIFQFLRRETDRLLELAWSDAVLTQVAYQAGGLSLEELRATSLEISQPSDGGWHFYADHPDHTVAPTMASTWAHAFVSVARGATEASPEMQAARAELNELVLSDPQPDDARLLELTAELTALAETSKGISLFVELYVSAEADLPTQRSVSLATYLLLGSLTGAALTALFTFLRVPKAKEKS